MRKTVDKDNETKTMDNKETPGSENKKSYCKRNTVTSERSHYSPWLSILKKAILLQCIVYISLPVMLGLFPWILGHVVFSHWLRFPYLVDLTSPAELSLNHTLNFYLSPEEGISLGVWHTVPDSQWEKAQGACPEWYSETLGDGSPVIIYLHGNVGSRAINHRVELVKILSAAGYHVLSLDYRGYGDSSGEPSEVGMTSDALYLYQWVKTRSRTSQVCLWGHSLGTGVATNAAVKIQEQGELLPPAPDRSSTSSRQFLHQLQTVPPPAPDSSYTSSRQFLHQLQTVPSPAPDSSFTSSRQFLHQLQTVPSPAPDSSFTSPRQFLHQLQTVPTPAPDSSYTSSRQFLHQLQTGPTPAPDRSYTSSRQFLHQLQTVPTPAPDSSFTSSRQFLHQLQTVPTPAPDSSYTSSRQFLHQLQTVPTPAPDSSFTSPRQFLHQLQTVPTPAPDSSFTSSRQFLHQLQTVPTPAPDSSFTSSRQFLHQPQTVPSPAPDSSYTSS
ncbi:mucin-5AC-like isoform X2 [Salvelinus namaycush]|uniref:Mucin-5AC-like isoform X2 n=1 Tax=Salvelinus namaycush TaxID=8040 RepID=A0A8U1EW47_SALNM|nr:mucin-5AC-like isoform X2 [Salvelinus namaycush]